MRRLVLSLAVVLLLAAQALAQPWSLEVFDGNAMGSGSIIHIDDKVLDNGWRYAIALTADHVCDNSTGIRIKFENGMSSKNCSVISRNRKADIALIRCLVPPDVTAIEVGDEPAEEGDTLNYVGRFRRHFSGDVSCLVYDGELWSDVVVYPGDSGGAVILDGKIIGCISGGMRWADNNPQRTWPCRSNNLQPLKALVDSALASNWKGSQTSTNISKSIPFKDYEDGDLLFEGLQLVVFSAGWCNPCKNLKAELKRQSEKLEELGLDRIVVVDIDIHRDLAKSYGVRVVPSTLIMKRSRIEKQIVGASANDIITNLARIGS